VTAGDRLSPPDGGPDFEQEEARLNELALALVGDEQFWPAAQTFARLAVLTNGQPSCDIHRRSLASAFEDLGWYLSSEHQLRRVIDESSVEEHREGCRDQLEHLSEVVAEHDADVRMRTLQFECALERAQERTEEVAELERLARLTVHAVDSAHGVEVAHRVMPIVGAAFEEHPGSVDIGRGILSCILAVGDHAQADELLQRLEALEPEAADLTKIAGDLAAGVSSPSVGFAPPEVGYLVGIVSDGLSGDDDLTMRAAALSDLRDIGDRWPHDSNAVFAYAFGLLAAGLPVELSAQLPRLVKFERPNQTYHYNMLQLCAAGGDQQQAKHHVTLACRYAVTDEERVEVDEIVQRFELENGDE